METPDIKDLAALLAAAMPRLDEREQHLALTLIRQLALGDPVSVEQLARAADTPRAEVAVALDRLPMESRDEQQRVIAFMGLSVVETGEHRIHLDGRTLSAWCAWDTLFLPELIGATAQVSSRCPTTGSQISLSVTPDGPIDLQPAEAVVSFLVPDGEFDATVIQSFCHFVHFFASPTAAATWTAEHPDTFTLSVRDAYELGQLTNDAVMSPTTANGARR